VNKAGWKKIGGFLKRRAVHGGASEDDDEGKGVQYAHLIGADNVRPTGVFPTGFANLDIALGTGGLAFGRSSIFHGPEACGKTTLALQVCARVQAAGGVAVFLDFEHKLSPEYAAQLGVDPDHLILSRPPYIEKGLSFLDELVDKVRSIDAGCPVVFVWDSLHAAPSKRTWKADFEKSDYPSEAQSYSRGYRKLTAKIDNTDAILITISQVRISVDEYKGPEKKGVGKAPLFYASTILNFKSRGHKVKRGVVAKNAPDLENVIVTIDKNSLSNPYRQAALVMRYGSGFDPHHSLLVAADMVGLAKSKKKGSAWWILSFDGEQVKVQGASGLRKFEHRDPDAFGRFRAAVYATIGRDVEQSTQEGAQNGEDDEEEE